MHVRLPSPQVAASSAYHTDGGGWGRRTIPPKWLPKLARVLNCSEAELMT
jgi:hypothetical protein